MIKLEALNGNGEKTSPLAWLGYGAMVASLPLIGVDILLDPESMGALTPLGIAGLLVGYPLSKVRS